MSERRHSKSVILEFKFYIFKFFWQSTNIKHVETLNFFKSKRVVCPYIYEGLETNSVWEADMFMRFKDDQKPQKGILYLDPLTRFLARQSVTILKLVVYKL